MNWIECGPQHLEAIRGIFNEAIEHSTALYEYMPRTPEFMQSWFDAKQQTGLPVLGAIDDTGVLMGFGSYGPFRPLPAYRHTAEHSVYVHSEFRGQGIGMQLLERLMQRAQQQGLHTLIGVIDAQNAASIRLHERLGFVPCGTLREVGYKFGRWLDVVLYQLILSHPESLKAG